MNIIGDFRQWIEAMMAQKDFARPPDGLLSSAKLFFILAGVSNCIMAGIRIAINDVKSRIISDALSGIALVLFAYFIQLYAAESITWVATLAYEIIAVGLLVILYSVLRYMLKKA
jgi:Flp pilus assembly protein protease CpaA